MKKSRILFYAMALVLGCALLCGCQTRTSDSGYTLKTIGKNVDSKIYILNVTMLGAPVSNSTMGGEGASRQYSDIYGYGNMKIWQEGKGLVSVHVNSISPSLDYVTPGMDIVLKTTDLKVMAINEGYSFEVKCRNDYEPVASLQQNETANDRYSTYELDYCRMSNPQINYEGTNSK